MKKLTWLIALIVALPVVSYGATYTLTQANYPINLNGNKLYVTPLNHSGTTYLPLRSISEALGVPITWDNATRSVNINTVDIEELKQSCVMIYADDGVLQWQGSGVYTDYSEVTTANHVAIDGLNIRTSQGAELTLEDSNNEIDIAVLETKKEVKPVKIGDSDKVKVGEKVILISSPDKATNTVDYGTVKENGKEIVVIGKSSTGSSGGALFNMQGELIGVLIAGDTGLKECYIVPINTIRKVL